MSDNGGGGVVGASCVGRKTAAMRAESAVDPDDFPCARMPAIESNRPSIRTRACQKVSPSGHSRSVCLANLWAW